MKRRSSTAPSRLRPLGAALALAAAAACGRPSAPPSDGASPPPPPAAPRASAPASAPDPSGLERLRGVVVLTAEAPRMTPCGEASGLDLRDATGGPLAEAYAELGSEQTGEMWIEGRGERTPEGVTLRTLERALPVGESDPCGRLLPEGTLRAQGNEPFWALTIGPEGILLEEPDREVPLAFPPAQPTIDGGRRTWRAEIPGTPTQALEIVVTPARCKDSMSGAWFPFAAEAVVDGRTLTGCAH